MIYVSKAQLVPEGDGVTVKRLMPVANLRNFDPFVLWDHFDIEGGSFPPHPHRGFEAVTWLFTGDMRHADNLGNDDTVRAGGAQRFTAGRGIVHSEMPEGRAAGIQLWINLPRRLKGIAPDYQQAGAVPENRDGDARVRHIVGRKGAIRLHTDVEYLDVTLPQGASWKHDIPDGWRGIVYAVEGGLAIGGQAVAAGQAALIEQETSVTIRTVTDVSCSGASAGRWPSQSTSAVRSWTEAVWFAPGANADLNK